MQRRPSLVLADLTYDTVVVSIEYFPIALGYIGGYLQQTLPDAFNISLVKFPQELEKRLDEDAPDILALSFWPWNSQLTLEAIRHYRERRPDGLVLVGGANFPMDDPVRQEFFLKKHAELIDICICHDGEMGMRAACEAYLACGGERSRLLRAPILGCNILHYEEQKMLIGDYIPRPVVLDEIPSPYLNGLMDPFFDNMQLTPLLQHTRGCPFTCAYCWAGNRRNRNIRQFSIERVCAELEYIAERRKYSTNTNFAFADSNFGMYPSDEKIAEKIIELQKKYEYPGYFYTPYGKNNRERVTRIVENLENADAIVSLQTTDKNILNNICRENMSVEQCMDIVKSLHEKGIAVQTEIITALPGETRETHLQTLHDVINIGFDEVHPFTLMLLEGTPLTGGGAQEKYGWDKRYRILPRNFGKYRGNIVFEVETVVVGSNTFSYDDFIYTRSMHCAMRMVFNHTVYAEYIRYLKMHNADMYAFLIFFHAAMEADSGPIGQFFEHFQHEIVDELWTDKAELVRHFKKEENYATLLSGEVGENLLGKIKAMSIVDVYAALTRFYAGVVVRYLQETHAEVSIDEVEDICRHLLAKGDGLWGAENEALSRAVTLRHSVPRWIDEGFSQPLSSYCHDPREYVYTIPAHGQKIRQEILAQLTGDKSSLWKIVGSRVFLPAVFRRPEVLSC